jgi:hypothetical protein
MSTNAATLNNTAKNMNAVSHSGFRSAATWVAGAVAVALVSPLAAQTTVLSGPVGVISVDAPKHESPMALPLISADLFVGIASGNAAAQVVFPDAEGDVGSLLAADDRYYLEVVTGPLEGERLDVDTPATIAAAGALVVVDLGEDSFSTLSSLPDDALSDARVVIRPHVRLSDIQALFTPGLEGRRHGRSGDGVWVLGDDRFDRFYLADDNESWHENDGHGFGKWANKHNKWHDRHGWRHKKKNPIDYRDLVVPPDTSIVVDIMSRRQTWKNEGIVRTNAFRKNLERGLQTFASGFPVALAPVDIGAFVDPDVPSGFRWTGNNLFLFADQFQILAQGDKHFNLYYLRKDGTTWSRLGGHWRTDYAGSPILGPTDMVILWRFRPNPEFVIPRPFDL